MKMPHKAVKQRNYLHDHPLMKKGGVHQKSNKAKRRAEKQVLQRDWDEQSGLLKEL
ncbi:MAG: hypothetical protein HY080_07565 [Gammaproteobacteria bacterium]|nr:hypothetical protein [Gammaproteobacteria bacterium]